MTYRLGRTDRGLNRSARGGSQTYRGAQETRPASDRKATKHPYSSLSYLRGPSRHMRGAL